MVNIKTAVYAIAAGVVAQSLFKRREPNVIAFLSFLLASAVLAYFYFVVNSGLSPWLAAGTTAMVIGVFGASLSLSTVLYRLSQWHPLANYPGPSLAKVSKWWTGYSILKGDRHLLLQRLHKQYGPWLRIGPNEISVNIPAAVRPIYGQMFRAPFYKAAPQDADALITTTDRVEHASRLIAWNKAFSADSLHNFREHAMARTDQLMEIFRRESSPGSPIEISRWIGFWAMDVMGDMSFSGGFETMAAGEDNEGWIKIFSMGVLFVGVLGQVPWIRDIIAMAPQPGPVTTFQQFAGKKVFSTRAKTKEVKRDILSIIQDESSGGPHLSDKEAAADASFIIVAGSDTVSQGLTALFRHIVGNEQVQNRLRFEINAAFEIGDDMDAVTLARLPYLDACVQETLRLVPPVPAGPPRYSGREGGHVLGRYIPPGTTVACPTYTLHRDAQNFKDPDDFKPERWFRVSYDEPHDHEAFIPFSYGLGVCIGKPVALHNIKLLAARTIQAFDLSFPQGFDPEKFDASYKEHNLWLHDPLLVNMKPI